MKSALLIKNTLILFLAIFTASLNAAPPSNLKLPNLELMGSDGKKHHLNDYLGKNKWTTMIIWGPKCPACIEEMPDIQRLYDEREKENIEVLGLAIDFPSFSLAKIKQVQQFEEDYLIDFPNLLISSNIYYELGLGALQGTPTIVLINPEGKVSAVQLGGVPAEKIKTYIAEENKKANALSKK